MAKTEELVIRPLDRGKRGANRLYLFAVVQEFSANQQVGEIPCFERPDVGPGHIIKSKLDKPPEERGRM